MREREKERKKEKERKREREREIRGYCQSDTCMGFTDGEILWH